MSNSNISVLDADFIIKSAVSPSPNEQSLLEKILGIGGDFYVHQQVYEEVMWPQEAVDLLRRLKEHQRIKIVNDKYLLELLEKDFVMPTRTFLSTIKDCCELFGTEHYENYYNTLACFVTTGESIEHFYERFIEVEKELMNSDCANNLGEIKTITMAVIFYITNKNKVTIFMSDDRRACNTVVLKYSEKYHEIKALSVIGSFFLLRKNGMTYDIACRYVNSLATKEFKVIDKSEKMTGLEIINGIYSNKLLLLSAIIFFIIIYFQTKRGR